MELAIPITFLVSYIGYRFNKNGKVPRITSDIRNSISENNTPSGNNVYNSISTKIVNQEQKQLAAQRMELSKDYTNTNIVPWVLPGSNTQVQNSILPSVKKKPDSDVIDINKSPIFNPPPFKILGKSLTGPTESGGFAPIITENFGNVSQLSGLEYDTENTNMVPHFGSYVKQNIDPDKNQAIIERYTGVTNHVAKKEVPSFFKPMQQNIHGHHYIQDRSRIIQSSLKTNQSPTVKIQVSPLPAASNRPSYKTSEQLNVHARQAKQMAAPILGVNPSQNKRGLIGHLSKNRPETAWEMGADRLLVGSTISAPASRENFRNGLGSASESTFEFLPAKSVVNGPSPRSRSMLDTDANPLDSLVSDSIRNTGHTTGYRNISGYIKEVSETTRNSHIARETERETTSRMTFMPAGDTKRGEYQPHPNIAKITNKQLNLFSYTGGASSSHSKPTNRKAEYNPTRNVNRLTLKNYMGLPVDTQQGYVDNSQYENMEIRSNKDVISDTRNYTHEIDNGSKIAIGVSDINIKLRDTIQDVPNKGFNFTNHSIIQEISDVSKIGESDVKYNKTISEIEQTERINKLYLNQLNDNPYALSILK